MSAFFRSNQVIKLSAWSFAVLLGVAAASASAGKMDVKLSGDQEVPPVQSSGAGSGTITINDDGSVSGSVTATGFTPTAAHIHHAAAGKNGPVIVPFTKEGDKFSAPAGAKLTADQMKAYKAGELYVNVHSAAHPGGEVRAQLKP
ncbi:MAG TPA: CHRD domain-containing protein [Casimicrobiaceae bacterium]|nr:CHRD domain-containing protein [Casimicrobiaceae bacterium]